MFKHMPRGLSLVRSSGLLKNTQHITIPTYFTSSPSLHLTITPAHSNALTGVLVFHGRVMAGFLVQNSALPLIATSVRH